MDFDLFLHKDGLYPLMATGVGTLQVNIGLGCNQSCRHCHVNAGPHRTEWMERSVMEYCLSALKSGTISTLDITGGAPEMHPDYQWFVESAIGLGKKVKTRTNLSILLEDGYTELPRFFADQGLEVIASMPCYSHDTVDKQRGMGIFNASIKAIKLLNNLGYGLDESPLPLNLVYNPAGAFLPPSQKTLEIDYKKVFKKDYGLVFTNLYAITNMPIGRFSDSLKADGQLSAYMELLEGAYNPEALKNVMCREIISVAWDGALYDCDFNQALGIKCDPPSVRHIRDFDIGELDNRKIRTANHCYACTAGAGSSCSGEVAA